VENPGNQYAYAYDLAGNRTDGWTNGTLADHHTYDAADQVSGWQYDAAGNLIGDGTATYTYDALNRALTVTAGSQTRSNSYNGDGVLVAQTANGTLTRYTQDLVSPLNQVLQTTQGSTTTSYLSGRERLAAVAGGTRTWYAADALGSVRRTLNESGSPLSAINYDPWGMPEGAATPPTFGFTGELQDATTGLVNLRARCYHAANGTFTSARGQGPTKSARASGCAGRTAGFIGRALLLGGMPTSLLEQVQYVHPHRNADCRTRLCHPPSQRSITLVLLDVGAWCVMGQDQRQRGTIVEQDRTGCSTAKLRPARPVIHTLTDRYRGIGNP
jgi:RHS repeat-associated protein